jgi:NADH-quinone oxidoreductase subunit H
VKLRFGILGLVFVGLPAIFFGLTLAFYGAAYLGESLFKGGGSIVNIVTLVLVAVMAISGLLTIAERKWSAAMQDRIGPNRAAIGPFRFGGIPHFLADALKMLFKEDFIPARASSVIFRIAPALVFAPVMALFAVIPVAPPVDFFGKGLTVALQIANPDFGLLYVFALGSLAVYGTSLAGWSSNNKFALLGGVRASSQMISYEVALGLSVIGLLACFSTLRMDLLANSQAAWLVGGTGEFDFGIPAWGILLQPVGFLLFFTAAFAETKRAPFDMPEGESEIVGYFVEYSGMRFGLFMLPEFVEVVVLSAVITVLFFGGYHLPFGEAWLSRQVGETWIAVAQGTAFWIKTLTLVVLQLLVRWTFPRFRYDQIQKLCWRMLLPLGIANVFVSAALVLLDPTYELLALVGAAEIVALVVYVFGAKPSAAPAAGAAHDSHGAHGARGASDDLAHVHGSH